MKNTPYISHVSRSYLIKILVNPVSQSPLMYAPVGTPENGASTRNAVRFACVRLHPNPPSILIAQQVIHNLEPLVLLREVDSRDIHNGLELALRMVAQEREDGYDARWADVQGEFVFADRELLNKFRQCLHEV